MTSFLVQLYGGPADGIEYSVYREPPAIEVPIEGTGRVAIYKPSGTTYFDEARRRWVRIAVLAYERGASPSA